MNLYVGNLPYSTTDEDLRDLFAAYGTVVSATVLRDRYSGLSRGFGFVEMSNDAEAEAAIQGLNGTMLEGRPLKVDKARPRTDRGGGGGREGQGREPRGGGRRRERW
ncbi:MAG: RNA recognition motif domain-containing protein [Anaerolineae bacterium]